MHPLVGRVGPLSADAQAAGATVAVLDIPLLFETGGEKTGRGAVVVVSAPADVQRARVLSRGVPEDRFDALLARQMPDAEKRRRADFVVDTSGEIELARQQVREFLLPSLGCRGGVGLTLSP